ncbi:response regulator [Lacihabitans sp. CCS-44]|uniref:LytR/AlgR family response regulator transcription factor n=1 Tax=Lacihabitans sp. CCS-44 TaxID=2487331 RepID=UPI0020CDE365|nr:response regulator transcription factor [Lacihabitans sp. CCS-44]MCP9753955.1 response regulator [Lacihabitans sp. CCS-44]
MDNDQINLLILEDDSFFQMALKLMLENTTFNIVSIIDEIDKVNYYLENYKIDLFICDLNIHGQFVSYDFLTHINSLGIPIVCITAHREEEIYAKIKDIVYGYLIKPFHKISLQSVMKYALEQFRKNKLHDFVDNKYLFIKKNGKIKEKHNYSEIIYLESSGNYCYLYTKTRKLIEKISLTKILNNQLDDRFKRVHHKFAVNTEYVESIGTNELILSSETKIPVSTTYRKNLKNLIN